jgi:hypothetical protein
MNTENIKAIFTDYLATEKTQYAILLNGTWGSGKTYFWKNDLVKIVVQKEFKAIYISLNGVSKIDALEHLLFLKLMPFIGNQENKTLKGATTIVTNVANLLGKNLFKTTLTDIFKDLSVDAFNFSKYVICFDDLERCQIPIKEVLGFINNYVEHKNLKTIIFSDEKNIDPNQTGYDNIKEKVVGRILNFELSIEETLPLLFKKYETNKVDFYNFLINNKQLLVEILTEYKQDNLRTISFYLEILEKVFPKIKNVDAKYIQETILFSAIITIEFKKGNLKSSDYKTPKGIESIDENYYSLNIARTMREVNNETEERIKPYAEIFYETYLDKRIKQYFYYQSIFSYILSGYIDLSELELEINKRYPVVLTKEIQDFRNLLNYSFRELSDGDFENLTSSVLKFAKEGKYSLYDYVQIANFYYFFSKNGLITLTTDQINAILIEGLDIAKIRKQINDRVLENLMRFGDENPDITKMKKIIKEIHFDIKKEQYIAESNELIDCLKNNDELVLAAIFEKHKFSKELFQYIDNKQFVDTITRITNKQIFNFTELLNDRYSSSNIGEFLYEDFLFLTTLQNDLDLHIKNSENEHQPKKYLIKTLHETLQSICIHLDDTKKK